jgi:hypothetical protein
MDTRGLALRSKQGGLLSARGIVVSFKSAAIDYYTGGNAPAPSITRCKKQTFPISAGYLGA